MNKSIKTLQISVVILYFVILAALLSLQAWSSVVESGFVVFSLIYWMILIGWVGLIWKFKWESSVSLIPAFILFALAALLTTIGLKVAGEMVMRLSFIGWLVGIVQALVEYKKDEKD